MEIKDNGLDLNAEAGQVALPKESAMVGAKEQSGSAVFRKFKDINALAQAYGTLEAEFTRRSQRLKELERMLARSVEESQENSKEKSGSDDQGGETPESGSKTAEQGSKVPEERSNGEIEIVQPECELGHEKVVADDEVGSEKTNDGVVSGQMQGFGEKAFSDGEELNVSVVAPSTDGVVQKLSDDEIYRMATENGNARKKIIEEYLASLKNAGAPLARGGVGAVASPPLKARSVSDAGNMALQFFRASNKS